VDDIELRKTWANIKLGLRYYVAAKLFWLGIVVLESVCTQEQAHAFKVLADALLADKRFD
jgi:hypothetical protein